MQKTVFEFASLWNQQQPLPKAKNRKRKPQNTQAKTTGCDRLVQVFQHSERHLVFQNKRFFQNETLHKLQLKENPWQTSTVTTSHTGQKLFKCPWESEYWGLNTKAFVCVFLDFLVFSFFSLVYYIKSQ